MWGRNGELVAQLESIPCDPENTFCLHYKMRMLNKEGHGKLEWEDGYTEGSETFSQGHIIDTSSVGKFVGFACQTVDYDHPELPVQTFY